MCSKVHNFNKVTKLDLTVEKVIIHLDIFFRFSNLLILPQYIHLIFINIPSSEIFFFVKVIIFIITLS